MAKKVSKLDYLLENIWYDRILDTYEDGRLAEAVVTQGGDVVRYRCEEYDGKLEIYCK